MGAFAGWLRHPAHAPRYYDKDHSKAHRQNARRDLPHGQRPYLVEWLFQPMAVVHHLVVGDLLGVALGDGAILFDDDVGDRGHSAIIGG